MLRQRISPPCVWSWIGALRAAAAACGPRSSPCGRGRRRACRSATPSVRSPTWRMRNVFHSPNGLSARTSGSLPGAPGLLFNSPPEPLSRAAVPLAALLGRVPDLHLRRGPQVDAAVGLGDGLVLDEQLDVAKIPFGRGKRAAAVVDQLAVLDAPMGTERRVVRLPLRRARLGCKLRELPGSVWPMPCQPVRSLPLNRATNPAGGASDAAGAATTEDAATTDASRAADATDASLWIKEMTPLRRCANAVARSGLRPKSSSGASPSALLGDLRKRRRREAGAADQRAVDVLLAISPRYCPASRCRRR